MRLGTFEWSKIINSEGRSVRIQTDGKRLKDEELDYIKLDAMETSTKQCTSEFIRTAPDIKEIKYNAQIIIPPTINYVFLNNKALDKTTVRLFQAVNY